MRHAGVTSGEGVLCDDPPRGRERGCRRARRRPILLACELVLRHTFDGELRRRSMKTPEPVGAFTPESVTEVPSRDLPYEEFLASFVRRDRPVVVRGAVAEWPALRLWTPDYFRTRFRDRPVQVSYAAKVPFSEFIDGVEASTVDRPGPYMYRLFLHESLPEVLDDLVPQNTYAFPGRLASPLLPEYWRRPDGYLKLLIGGVGGGFPVLHFDTENVHASVTEIYGDKEFILFPPGDGAYLYPKPEQPNHSAIDDPTAPDLDKFPLAANATCYRTVLRPGDMVFVPCRWWHTARVLSTSISVGMNMLDRSNWDGFVREVSSTAWTSRPKALLKRAYFRMVGLAFDTLEGMQHAAPSVARTLAFPRRLAPLRATDVPEPSLRPLNIRIGTQ
jgi:Cupin-like domain